LGKKGKKTGIKKGKMEENAVRGKENGGQERGGIGPQKKKQKKLGRVKEEEIPVKDAGRDSED